ncbi:MAG: leucine--tRNA ligase [Bacteroidota bacterium]|nr:leucine--tRNA ligase [Bacteroidota bacterium]MDP4216237.1 leucine--tRNA ligase [Bacteroidota bacterium]MDP4254212.1 leucine--tRNA ligase [Bacteroidota bacterium]MDP4256765.1 leucine--tRNA ligase [Bacteroidota bacterium]
MEYNFSNIERKWHRRWNADERYKVRNDPARPKFYVLDMFPYPSGAGLHVGHPLGYIASDIYARFKRLKGFNVLHPMGYDAFGLPAEQYAIDHGVHPAISTAANIANFRAQLDNIGFCFDWSRSVNTSEPQYYKWTQWIFLQLFKSWYDRKQDKASSIDELLRIFASEGNSAHPCPGDARTRFTAGEWNGMDAGRREEILMGYRLAYCGYGEVNWCEALGTVLANDEVINGVSERGGYPVVKKKLRQWYLRITDYADRLLEGLEHVDFSDSMKEMQTNWIGKSYGAEIDFAIAGMSERLRVYTTRPDTIFGVDFMVLAPEHELVERITSAGQRQAVSQYVSFVRSRSERERMAEKKISGCFTGAYAVNPFNGREIPIWVSEYVLAGYGTGAIMAVPCGDERDHKFARHFDIPVTNIIGDHYDGVEANPTKDAKLSNSEFLDGIVMREAIGIVNRKLEEMGIGTTKVNYRMRDAAFSRQRYWGEPFPIVWRGGIAYPLDEKELPLELPHVEKYGPGPEGEGPLANVPAWTARHLETNTMPGYAGSSWYFLRYMDPHNEKEFCSRMASDYWGQVDLYIGGTEHAVGHLLYSRMWTKFLYDAGYIGHDEPYKRLVNQGMIQGSSRFVYRVRGTNRFVSHGLKDRYETDAIHVDVNMVDGLELDIEAFKKWRPENADAEFILEDGKYICGAEVEKMSKRLYNTVNPNDLVNKYGADAFRMYEMFLGPVEQSKPWDTKGIEGVHRFLRKLWRLFFDEAKGRVWTNEPATEAEWKVLYKTIRKVEEDTERFSFNTGVSALMIGVNELSELKCGKKEVLEKLLIILTPYAPHICEELWELIGNGGDDNSILDAPYPTVEEKYLIESAKNYPIAINGRTRTELNIALDATQQQIEELILADETVKKWLEGRSPKKVIYVKNKMINVVV